jgi:hypothetical protein
MVERGFGDSAGRPDVQATGEAGAVYLRHPFLVHAAQIHRGTRPRFLAQPPLLPRSPTELCWEDDGGLPRARSGLRQR